MCNVVADMIYHGDCREVMARMLPESVQCIVTSPPYFGLRAYEGLEPSIWGDGWKGCLGNEPDPRQYIAHMVEVFEGARRVLKKDGIAWLNLGDSFNAYNHNRGESRSISGERGHPQHPQGLTAKALKNKDLMLMPHRVAIALQEAGWFVRMDVVWHKPNPMPESVRDRPTKAHEYVFLLTKSARYYYDADAVREPHASAYSRDVLAKGDVDASRPAGDNFSKERRHKGGGMTPRTRGERAALLNPGGRNRRSVWRINTKGYKGAHFAVMPEALAEVCVLAGSRRGDLVFDPFCGSGTTGLAAMKYGRFFVGAEASAEYVRLAEDRLSGLDPLRIAMVDF